MSLLVNIRKRFKGFMLDVNFTSSGKPLGILGASGSGKSMTLRCIAGIETPDEGLIELNGRILFDSEKKINIKPQKRKVGYLFQNYALFPNMTAEENIACALSGSKAENRQSIDALITRYALSGLAKRYPAQLSGGQQQRVALARIMAYEPEVLLLDEPFSALDSYLKEALQIEMLEILSNYEGEAVMVTHNRDEVYKLSENLLVLDEGRALAMGDTRRMFENPEHLAVARLTGCKNFSRAVKSGDNRVQALDWGCELYVNKPITGDLTHIGVRAHYFVPAQNASAVNAMPIKVRKRIESPFEWNVMFQCAGYSDKSGNIWWKYAKENDVAVTPEYLSIAPQNVLLLSDKVPGAPNITKA